jgi:hypothetical protein
MLCAEASIRSRARGWPEFMLQQAQASGVRWSPAAAVCRKSKVSPGASAAAAGRYWGTVVLRRMKHDQQYLLVLIRSARM